MLLLYIGIMETKEESIVYWGSIGIMEKKMETIEAGSYRLGEMPRVHKELRRRL